MKKRFLVPVLALILWVLFFGLCGFVWGHRQQSLREQCFQLDDTGQRYACLRRV